MREVKFRAWPLERDVREYNQKISGTPFYTWEEMRSDPEIMAMCLTNEQYCIPLQFTGLHDKSGVEIYEGDIVLLELDSKWTGEIIWADDVASFRWLSIPEHDRHELSCYQPDEARREVIGNIYENRDLLK